MQETDISKPLTGQEWDVLEALVARMPATLDHAESQLGNVQEFRNTVADFEVMLDVARVAASYADKG